MLQAYTDLTYSTAMDQAQMKKMNRDFTVLKSKEGEKLLEISLNTNEEEAESFFQNQIFPSIQCQWRLSNSRGMAEWLWHSSRLKVGPGIHDVLLKAYESQVMGDTESSVSARKQIYERDIIRKELFERLRNENEVQLTFMRQLWPTSFVAELLSEFRMIPGNASRLLQLGLVEGVLNDQIAPDSDCASLIAYVKAKGVDTLCRIGLTSKFSYFQDTNLH